MSVSGTIRGLSSWIEAKDGRDGSTAQTEILCPVQGPSISAHMASVSTSKRIGGRAELATCLSYGGFGALRWGLSGRLRAGKQVVITLASPHVPGFISQTTRGMGVMAGVAVGF
jgi:hypothetical protein